MHPDKSPEHLSFLFPINGEHIISMPEGAYRVGWNETWDNIRSNLLHSSQAACNLGSMSEKGILSVIAAIIEHFLPSKGERKKL